MARSAPHVRSFAAFDGAALRGYDTIWRCSDGCKIGPLFADDLSVARKLFRVLVAAAGGTRIVLDTPESNPAAIALAVEHEMQSVFEKQPACTRASRGRFRLTTSSASRALNSVSGRRGTRAWFARFFALR